MEIMLVSVLKFSDHKRRWTILLQSFTFQVNIMRDKFSVWRVKRNCLTLSTQQSANRENSEINSYHIKSGNEFENEVTKKHRRKT